MREFILLSFIIFASTSIGYHMGYRSAVNSALTNPVLTNPVLTNLVLTNPVTVDVFDDFKNIDNWFLPCSVIHIEIIERNEIDERFSSELNDVINKFVNDNSKNINKSTFVKYCDGASVHKNYHNRT